jgi:hypothetical protein
MENKCAVQGGADHFEVRTDEVRTGDTIHEATPAAESCSPLDLQGENHACFADAPSKSTLSPRSFYEEPQITLRDEVWYGSAAARLNRDVSTHTSSVLNAVRPPSLVSWLGCQCYGVYCAV